MSIKSQIAMAVKMSNPLFGTVFGSGSHVNVGGRTVCITDVDVRDQRTADVLLGHMVHEGPGHLELTDFDVGQDSSRNEFDMLNIVEDIRIESRLELTKPGARHFLAAMNEALFCGKDPKRLAVAKKGAALHNYCLMVGLAIVLRYPLSADLAVAQSALARFVTEEGIWKIRTLMAKCHLIPDTGTALLVAQEILRLACEHEKTKPEMGSDDQDQNQGDDQDQDQGDDQDQNQGDGQDQDQGDDQEQNQGDGQGQDQGDGKGQDQGDDQDQNQGDGQGQDQGDDQDQNQGDGQDQLQDGDQAGTRPYQGFASAEGAENRDKLLEEILGPALKSESTDVEEAESVTIPSLLGQAAWSELQTFATQKRPSSKADEFDHQAAWTQQRLGGCASRVRSILKPLLQAQTPMGVKHVEQGENIAMDRLVDLIEGRSTDVFERDKDVLSQDVEVEIMLDLSTSMAFGKFSQAWWQSIAVATLCEGLRGMNGVSLTVSAIWSEKYVVVKEAKQRLSLERLFTTAYAASGGTPMMEGIMTGVGSLYSRKGRGKLLLILTDAEVPDFEAQRLAEHIRKLESFGMKIGILGIKTEHAIPCQNFVNVNDIENLHVQLAEMALRLLRRV